MKKEKSLDYENRSQAIKREFSTKRILHKLQSLFFLKIDTLETVKLAIDK